MIALGAKCSIGDQLHPSGEMNRDTYQLIGQAYREVAAKQAWCDNVRSVAKICLFSSDRNQESLRLHIDPNTSDEGASRMLLELQLPFIVLDDRAAWNGLDVVILPDNVLLTAPLLKRLKAFLAKGGKIMASGASLLNEKRTAFAVNAGLKLSQRSPFDTGYLVPTDQTPGISIRSGLVIHGGSWDATPQKGTKILAGKADPYFDRSWKAFCSHQFTPDAGLSKFPAITATKQVAWFAHDIFARYRHYGQPLYRDYFEAALRHLLPGGLPVESNLPSGGRVGLMEQSAERRYLLHLLFATPSSRGGSPNAWVTKMEIIEELIPLHNIACRVNLPRKIKTATLVPEGTPIAFKQDQSGVSLVLEKLEGHQMIEFAY